MAWYWVVAVVVFFFVLGYCLGRRVTRRRLGWVLDKAVAMEEKLKRLKE